MAPNLPNLGQDGFNLVRLEAIGVLSAPILTAAITDYISTGRLELPGVPKPVVDVIIAALGEAESLVGEPLFDALLGGSLGITDLGAPGSQEEAAVRTIKRALGFGVGLPIAAGAAEVPLKALLGPHLGEQLFASLRDISNEAGISFFLGLTLSNIFETAVGAPLTEAIARRTHPARFDYRITKQLLKQHSLTDAQARDALDGLGYRKDDADLILTLADALLTVGDLQQAFQQGIRDEAWVRDRLDTLGYQPADVDVLVELYLRRAETGGGDLLRTTAQRGFLEGHLSEAQYRAILTRVNVPKQSVDLEVEAARLQISWGRQQLSVSELKTARLAGRLDDHAAIQRLMELGYTNADAVLLVDEWTRDQKAGAPALSEARILGYLLGKVIDRDRAIELLIQTGLKVADATFIADHPSQLGGVYAYPLKPDTVTTALKDEVITTDDALALLVQLNVDPTQAALMVQIANASAARGRKPKQPTRNLSEGQVLDAFRQGLVSPSWVLSELALLGYADADAQLIVAVEETKLTGELPAGWVTLT